MTRTEQTNNVSAQLSTPSVPMILAEQVLALFQQSGTTPREQNAALDIARAVVLDQMYSIDWTPERST
jgi:hypothetical protein